MVDFSKHKRGDVVAVHCCDSCAITAGVKPKRLADSGKASWFCDVCGHHGIGSLTDCEIGDWLRLRPLQPNPWVMFERVTLHTGLMSPATQEDDHAPSDYPESYDPRFSI